MKSKQRIENKYWLEFLRFIEANYTEELKLYQKVAAEQPDGTFQVSIARNEHNFWYWYQTHKMVR